MTERASGPGGRIVYRRFEDLPVWNASIGLAAQVFELSGSGPLKGHPGLRDQLERAVLSISNTIAEGYERGTHEELLTFLYIARGSAGEVRSMLHFLEQSGEWVERRSEIARMRDLALNVSQQLGGWLEKLKQSSNKGPRYQNDQTRQMAEAARRQNAFLEEIRRVQDEHKSGQNQRGSDVGPRPPLSEEER